MKFLGIEITREKRSALDAVDDRWYTNLLFFPKTASGAQVTPENSIRLTAVWCAVKIISEAIASLPLHLYQRDNDLSKSRDLSHPLAMNFSLKPNNWQTPFEFFELMTVHMLLRGNAFAQIIPTRDGQLKQLIPLDPDRMEVKLSTRGNPQYYYRRPDGKTRVFQHWQIFHLRGMSLDGLVGLSPIQLCRECVGLSLSAEEYCARFYSNDATPGGVLEHPSKLDDRAHARIKTSWMEAHSGTNKAHKPAILEEGMTWKPIQINARDAQFIEARKFQIGEIARLFNLPPHLLKDLDRATFSNIESQDLAFLKHSIRPWLTRWEQAVQRDIIYQFDDEVIEGTEFPKRFVEFKADALLRSDIKTRNQSYAIALQWGWHSINEIRAMENMNPIEGGDIHLAPLNMVPIDKLPEFGEALVQGAGNKGGNPSSTAQENDVDDEDRSLSYVMDESWNTAFSKVFEETLSRLHRREEKELEKIKRQEKSILDWTDYFYEKNSKQINDALLPVVAAYMEQLNPKSSHDIRNVVTYYVECYIKNARQWLRADGIFPNNRTKIEVKSLLDLIRNHNTADINRLVNGVDKHVN